MGNGLSGISSVAYQGTNAATPPNITTHHNRPTPNFYQNFQIGDFWVYIPLPPGNNNELWVLMGVAANIANWVLIGGGTGSILYLHTDDGNNVTPTLGLINIHGGAGIATTGTNGPNTVTIATSGVVALSYPTNSGTAIPAAGVLNVLGAGGITTSGSGNTVTITGSGGTVSEFTTSTDGHVVTPTAGNINLQAGTGMSITGTVGPNTVTFATAGSVSQSFPTDNGTATPVSGVLNIFGTGSVSTSGSGNTVTVNGTGGGGLSYANIGLTINTGASTITINSASGAAFSATNPGYITFPSLVTPGTFVTIAVTSNVSMTWASMSSNTMGIVSGVAWGNGLPLYLYAVLNNTENACTFAWSRVPNHAVSSANSSGGLGSPAFATANSNANNAFFLFQSVTLNDYASTPVVLLGSAIVTADTTPAWTFSAISPGITGIGCFCEEIQFTMPFGQNGAYTGSIFNGYPGGTPPLSNTAAMLYALKRDGTLFIDADMSDIGTAGTGSGADILVLMSPYFLGTRGGSCFTAGSGSTTLTGAYKAVPLFGGGTYGYCGISFTQTEPTIMLTNKWNNVGGSGMQGSLNMSVLAN